MLSTATMVALGITYPVCVFVTLGMQHTMRMRLIICGLFGFAVSFHISHKENDFRKEVIRHKICAFLSSTPLSETCFILRTERDIIRNIYSDTSANEDNSFRIHIR